METLGESGRGGAESLYLRWRDAREAGGGESFEELCARHPEHAEQLRKIRAGSALIREVLGGESTLVNQESAEQAEQPLGELLARLESHAPARSRYEQRELLGEGGMGAVYEVFDVDLRRSLAKKVIGGKGRDPAARARDAASLSRFIEEAQVTAQLSHPGVVPVHELGIDEEGRVFFTMERVEGRRLDEVFALARRGAAGWSLARAVGVLVRVCETIAFAHSRGVLHRDLKPSNVMVGEFGQVYVLDWGLAKLRAELGEASEPDEEREGSGRRVSTDRKDASDRGLWEALASVPGTVSGTAGYMAPEQARGETDALDERTDVWALGALLYTLLAGQSPFAKEIAQKGRIAAITSAAARAPEPIATLAPDAPVELVSVAEKALAVASAARYTSAEALADDLRAWLEGRVVAAHERGALAELRKWVLRNKALAGALALALVAVLGGAGGMAAFERSGRLAVEHQRDIAEVQSAPATMDGLLVQLDQMGPALPERTGDLARWLEQARALAAERPRYEGALAALRGEASRYEARDLDARMRAPLEELLRQLDALPERLQWAEQRLALASTLDELTHSGPRARARWREAIDSIATLEVYRGLELEPQLGLLPLRRDPRSGLWEFWHALSGAEPELDPKSDRWRIAPEMGVVLVLIPPGTYAVGTPEVPPGHALDDEYSHAESIDRPQYEVELDAFFLSKYELTRAQWMRATRENPSAFSAPIDTLPADSISWNRCAEVLPRLDLWLPTETQWEAAARGGQPTRFYTGQFWRSLVGHVNLLPDVTGPDGRPDYRADTDEEDRVIQVYGAPWEPMPSPVGSFEPNPFGLHDVHGNLWEWCLDVFDMNDPIVEPRPGDGLRPTPNTNAPWRILRGGAFGSPWPNARVAYRYSWERSNREPDCGLRPARPVRRGESMSR